MAEDTFVIEESKEALAKSSFLQESVDSTDGEINPLATSLTTQAFAKQGDTDVALEDFEIKAIIGRGAFGKVQLVQNKKNGEIFAMKSLKKHRIIETKSIE